MHSRPRSIRADQIASRLDGGCQRQTDCDVKLTDGTCPLSFSKDVHENIDEDEQAGGNTEQPSDEVFSHERILGKRGTARCHVPRRAR